MDNYSDLEIRNVICYITPATSYAALQKEIGLERIKKETHKNHVTNSTVRHAAQIILSIL